MTPQLVDKDASGREFHLLELPTLDRWSISQELKSGGFCLFLAGNWGALDTSALCEFASAAVDDGCASVCVWGESCEKFHDIFDETDVGRSLLDPESSGVLMTAWHEMETLEEALDFFVRFTIVDKEYAPIPNVWLVVTWVQSHRQKISKAC